MSFRKSTMVDLMLVYPFRARLVSGEGFPCRQGTWGRAACAAAAVAALAAGCSSGGGVGRGRKQHLSALSIGPAEKTTLNVGVVPAMDSAGFFVALHDGLFAKEGLTINYTPAVSSETAVAQQLQGQLDITGGNYVSYIQAAAVKHDPIEVIAEGSIMQQGAQMIFTMPKLQDQDPRAAQGPPGRGERAGQHRLPARRLGALRRTASTPTWTSPRHMKLRRDRRPIPFPDDGRGTVVGQDRRRHHARAVRQHRRAGVRRRPARGPEPGRHPGLPDRGVRGHQGLGGADPNTLKRFLAALEIGPGDRRHRPRRRRAGLRDDQGRRRTARCRRASRP